MNLYLASSWKNEVLVMKIKRFLEESGFHVDAFCDTSGDRFVFNFKHIPDIASHDAKSVLDIPLVQRAFAEDKKWLDWADAVVLILPSGKSAHLEAGYAKGAGKMLVIYQEEFPKMEYDVMYGFADLVTSDIDELWAFLKRRSISP